MNYHNYPKPGILITTIVVFGAIISARAADSPASAPAGIHNPRPQSYRIASSYRRSYSYDAKAEIQAYAQLAADSYAAALADGVQLKAAVDAFLAGPSDETLLHARDAWINARRSWEQTEAFRFYDGPVDVTDNGEGPQRRVDGWPVDPAAIDYTQENPTAGIVNNMKLALTRTTLLGVQTQSGEHAVVTGWHAIEFLLWGQETEAGEEGDRPPTDYLAGQPNNDRRRAYLKLITGLLVDDLRYLVESWDPKAQDYASAFRLLNQREAVGRMMSGIALLSGQELAITRLAGALDSKDRKLLTSRFSGTSYNDFTFALRGVRNVWTGDHGVESRAGLEVLVTRTDPALAQRIAHALNLAEGSVAALRAPLERETLPAAPGSPARQTAERAIADMKRLASLIRDAGVKLGVSVNLPN